VYQGMTLVVPKELLKTGLWPLRSCTETSVENFKMTHYLRAAFALRLLHGLYCPVYPPSTG